MSFTKLLHGFSFDHPWFNCVASLHRSLTGLHPVDICFVNNFFFRAVLAVCLSWCLVFRTLVQDPNTERLFFRVCIFKKLHYQSTICMLHFVASASMLWTSITPLDMMVSMAANRVLVIRKISNNKDKILQTINNLLLCKNINVCLMKTGKLIFVNTWDFLLGFITDFYMNTLTVCWFNRMKQD